MLSRLKILVCASLFATLMSFGCAKQTPDMPPGTAALANIKTAIHTAQGGSAAARDALPTLIKNADADDIKTATGILDDVDKGLAGLDKTLEPYTSFDSSNQAQIKQAIGDFLDFLKQMQKDRVTHIKNSQLEARVNLGLNLATDALKLWRPAGSQ